MADYTQQGLYQEGNSLFDDIFAFGDLEVQNINVVGIITAKTFSGVDATSLKDDNGNVKIQATTTGATHSGRAVFYDLEIQNKIYDGQGEFGSAGKVLSSTGAGVTWANAGSLSAGSAAQVSVVDDANSNSSRFITFVDSSSGNLQVKTDSQLSYNPFSNTINTVNIVGDLTGDVTGTILTAAQTNITSVGTLTGLTVNGTVNVQNGNLIQLRTSSGNLRGYIQSTETNDQHLIIATSGGEDIAFKDGGVGGTTNMVIRGDGNVVVSNGGVTASSFTGDLTGDVNATSVTGTLQTAAQTNITSVGTLTGLTVDGNVNIDNTSNYLSLKGGLKDKDGNTGNQNEVLVSTGSGQVDWKNPNTLTASNSVKVTITEDDTNSDFPITFSETAGQTGGNDLLSDNQFTYNAFSNTVTAGTFSGSGASLTSLNADNINSGTIASARVPTLNQNTTGSAAKLTTARNIAGSSFDGTANINIDYNNLSNRPSLFDGNYNSLSNRPTIPTQTSQLTNNSGFITGTDVRSANEATSTGQSSTTSTSFADKVTLSIPTVSNSRVLVAYSFEIKHSNTNNHSCKGLVTGNNVSFVGGALEEENRDTGFQRFNGTILDISSHTGTRTYRIQFRTTANSGQIQNASLVAIEMSV